MNGREFTRVNYLARAAILYDDTVVAGHTNNLSLCGVFIETLDDIPLNTPVDVMIDFRSSHESFNFNANVARKVPGGVGLKIASLNVDSFVRLRDVICKNSDDPGKVMDETFGMLKYIAGTES
jgi:hypothetical protein